MEALDCPTIKCVVIIAEGVPESQVRHMIAKANKLGKVIIGPATVGGLQAGAFKIGDAAGTITNVVESKLYRPGSVGLVTKSGGLSNEMYRLLSKYTDGVFEGIAVGGDAHPGSTLLEHVLRFQQIPEIKMIVVLGEVGGTAELEVAQALADKKITKPVVAWVSGTCATLFPTEVQFGHAGAKSGSDAESAQSKNAALKQAGAHIPESFNDFHSIIEKVYHSLVTKGIITPRVEEGPQSLPESYVTLLRDGRVRRETGIVSTICDDRGEEPTYCGMSVSDIIEEKLSIGDVISLLWFKRRLPTWASRFIEMTVILTADHGPCVSGAHNTIVAARAGKDIVSCLASGLLTIGDRFGGAIDDAARQFRRACDAGLSADEFVESMKREGKLIPGIGHRIKSQHNPDRRVTLLKDYARTCFSSLKYLDFALAVERYTLQKASNLILNVDGTIATLFLDLMDSSASFDKQEIDEMIDIGFFNGLFVLARSIGLIGHALDQKRLRQPLYRHPWDDVMYTAQTTPTPAPKDTRSTETIGGLRVALSTASLSELAEEAVAAASSSAPPRS
jgi:ATP citrate (pro-S)-lyase